MSMCVSMDARYVQIDVGVQTYLYLSSYMYIGVCVCIAAGVCIGMCLRTHTRVGVRGCMCRCIFILGQLWERECVHTSVHISMWVSVFL